MQRSKTVSDYLKKHSEWKDELAKLRKILVATELEETIKWGAPCYTIDGKNVIGLAAFTEYAGLWFHQGVFLKDADKLLVNAQAGKTKGLRQWRFTSAKEIKVAKVRSYVLEAIENQKSGKTVKVERNRAIVLPAELKKALGKKAKTKKAFDALTPGKQREYAEHVASAKRAETKVSRVAKIVPMIEAGIGLNDKYRSC